MCVVPCDLRQRLAGIGSALFKSLFRLFCPARLLTNALNSSLPCSTSTESPFLVDWARWSWIDSEKIRETMFMAMGLFIIKQAYMHNIENSLKEN